MKLLNSLFIVALTFVSIGVSAQTKTNVHYGMALPLGDTKDFINPTSFRGANFEYEKFVKPEVGVGFFIGWNTFYEAKERGTYPIENGAITSNQYRYLNVIPIHATGKYYFAGDDAGVRPYVGFGFGTYYVEQRNDNGLFSTADKGWTWGLAPKAGVMIPINYKVSCSLSLDYSTSFKSSDLPQSNWFGINVGLSWDH
ncbi:OmpW family outer membrane protein [Carboxylicivirga sp. RSCT41]|uniref:OmpW family outer membrane protein n=1 Tax=Carboxylicivirga agarovorans TaxID=3417570 RepID=UPI003D330696